MATKREYTAIFLEILEDRLTTQITALGKASTGDGTMTEEDCRTVARIRGHLAAAVADSQLLLEDWKKR